MNDWCNELCGTDCSTVALPALSDPTCTTEQDLNFGGISKVLFTNGAPLVEWTTTMTACDDPVAVQAAFDARISNAGTDIEQIQLVGGFGSLEEALGDKVILSGFEGLNCEQSIYKPKTYTLNFTISKTNCTNYEWSRAMSCVGKQPKYVWIGDCNNNVFGGSGISLTTFNASYVFPTDNSLQTIQLTATFTANCLFQRLSGLSLRI